MSGDTESQVVYTGASLQWNDETLHAAFVRQPDTGLLEMRVVLADASGEYPAGELFEYVTKYGDVPSEILESLRGTMDVLIKDYSETEGILKVLMEAGIVGAPTARVQTSPYSSVSRCSVLVDLPTVPQDQPLAQ